MAIAKIKLIKRNYISNYAKEILPNLLASVTRKSRTKVTELKWSKNSWVHNIFRFYELLFWRKDGIRCESRSSVSLIDGRQYISREFFTVESCLAHIEGLARSVLYKFSFSSIKETVEILRTLSPLELQRGGIAFGSYSTVYAPGASSATVSHTLSGSNLAMVSNGFFDAPQTISSVTYAGVGETQIGSPIATGGDRRFTLYYLIAPATGTNNVVITFSGATNGGTSNTYYSGVKQTDQPDASGESSGSGTVVDGTVTVVADNSWLVMTGRNSTGAFTVTAGGVDRSSGSSVAVLDSNAAVAAGSRSITTTIISGDWGWKMISLAPAAAAGPVNLKSLNTNLKANIKSVNTNPIANIKSLNTNV